MATRARPAPRTDQEIAEVERYRAFIDEQDPIFQPVTQFLTRHLGVEHAGVSLVGREVVELLSVVDLPVRSLERAGTLCALLLESGDDAFQVHDATADPRVAHLPVVTGPPHVRSYASVALRSPRGIGLGALFVMSSRPRTFTDDEIDTLRAMARQVETLLELRYREGLTGLPNRAGFLAELDRHLADGGRPLTVAYVEIPDHRMLNTAYGREVGDEVLREVGRRLRESADAGLVAHLGDAAFAVAWDDGPLLDARRASLRERLREPVVVDGTVHDVRVRVGLAGFPRDGVIAQDLLDRAATAAATSVPGRAARHYEEVIDHRSRSAAQTLVQLRGALAGDDLVVHYQPQVSLTSGRVAGFEALVRLRDVGGVGLVGPDRFLPVADENGLSTAVDLHVLRVAALQSRAWDADGDGSAPSARVAVNMSRASLLDDEIVRRVGEVLDEVGVTPGLIEVEITEKVFDSGDPDRLGEVLGGFRDLGLTVAMDDFGTGMSNLDALRSLPVDRVKVDRSFVHGIARNDVLGGLYRLISGLADILSVDVVAEGAECLDDVLWLLGHGCPTVQGWFCAPAVGAEEAASLAARVEDALRAATEPGCVDADALAVVGAMAPPVCDRA